MEKNFNLYEKFYGSYVQMNDRLETVHIWDEIIAIKNAGRWIPQLITKLEYDKQKQYNWNN